MNFATLQTNSGSGHVLSNMRFDCAERLPSFHTSTPTNSKLFGKKWLLLKMSMTDYMLGRLSIGITCMQERALGAAPNCHPR